MYTIHRRPRRHIKEEATENQESEKERKRQVEIWEADMDEIKRN